MKKLLIVAGMVVACTVQLQAIPASTRGNDKMITDEQKEFLKKLIDTPTPTGSEAAGALLLGRRIREKTGIEPTIDVHGNLHAVYDVGAKTTVMLEGHGDEIGYIVQYIDKNGYVYLQNLGGVVVPLTAAERLVILASHKRKPNKSSWRTDSIIEPLTSNEHEII